MTATGATAMRVSGLHAIRIVALRGCQVLGAAGVLGLSLGLAASASFAHAYLQVRALGDSSVAEQAMLPEPLVATRSDELPARALLARLPHPNQLTALLQSFQQAAQSQGLLWSSAEYRVIDADEQRLPRLEVRASLQGGYPAVRAWLNHMLDEEPAFALLQLGISRETVQSPDVQARLTLGVFLHPVASTPPGKEAGP